MRIIYIHLYTSALQVFGFKYCEAYRRHSEIRQHSGICKVTDSVGAP